jgi:hypothetical protein
MRCSFFRKLPASRVRRTRLPASAAFALLWLTAPALWAAAPVVTNQPIDQTVFYGDAATFRAGASGSAPLYYQWYRDGAKISGAITNSYSLSSVASNDDGAGFYLVVTNVSGAATSALATLTVDFGLIGDVQTNRLLSMGAIWKFNQTGTNIGASWMLTNYSDSLAAGWLSGPGIFDQKYLGGNPTNRLTVDGEQIATLLTMKQSGTNVCTFYFRGHFNFPWSLSQVVGAQLQASALIDDGAVFYLNGSEGYRLGVTNTAWNAWASRTIGDPTHESFALPLTNLLSGSNLIAVELHQAASSSSDITFGLALDASVYPRVRDTNAPTLAALIPAPGMVAALTEMEVQFSEGVKGIAAADLLVNGVPATNVTAYGPDIYVFEFPSPSPGPVQLTWSATQKITDLSANSNHFAGGTFNYTLNPATTALGVRINEFMAGNGHTIRDDTGKYSDWIELYNANEDPIDLSGWYLTDDPAKLTKWKFPAGVSMLPYSYMLVWASGQDHTNPAAPLHTNFKLSQAAGSYLELVYWDGVTVISAFAPYPQQFPDVSYGRDRMDLGQVGYFTNATPGAANATVGPGFGPEVQFSVVSRTFQQPFTLTLSTSDSNAVIRYLLVNSGAAAAVTNVPTSASTLYTGPLTISGSTQVRARAFSAQSGTFPGPLHNETYLLIGSDVTNFSSDLPVVVFHNMGGGAVAVTADQFMTMQVFDKRSNGRSSLLNPPEVAVQGYFHRRGQASLNTPKANLRVETEDAYGDNLDVELLGMPSDNDWVFYAINMFDKVLMHNRLPHDIYRDMGHYTSRTRFIEVFLKDDSGTPGPITMADYNGLYVLEEKIKIGKNRVDIDQLQVTDTNAPNITGGYLLSIDKVNPGATVRLAGQNVWHLDPDYYTIMSSPWAAQRQYINNYFNAFYYALTNMDWTNPVTGYAAYIDFDSWIDYHLHQVLTYNVDMLSFSHYFYKPRNGKIVQGPLWDFDRAFANSGDDTRGYNPRIWGSGPFNQWYAIVFKDPDFYQRYIDRYQELRRTTYNLTNLFAKIDQYGNEVREATTREYVRWKGQGGSDTTPRSGTITANGFTYTFPTPGTWQGEIDFTKNWFSNRVEFLDTNFINPPVFSSSGGVIPSGFVLTITASTGQPHSSFYYTLDGADPRLPGNVFNPTAQSGRDVASIVLTQNARVVARTVDLLHQSVTGGVNPPIGNIWSGPTAATFIISTPTLEITEIMCDPPPATGGDTNDNDNFEFIELKNFGTQALNLVGFRFTNGIDFTFTATSAMTNLAPGQYLVLVANQAAFASRFQR